jgi:YHS domain-containing protein
MSQVRDPVCGRMVDIDAATGRMTYESQELYFCSEDCRVRFAADPERFDPERHEPPYTVKGGFVAPKFGSAASGGLEYEATPERDKEKPPRRKK